MRTYLKQSALRTHTRSRHLLRRLGVCSAIGLWAVGAIGGGMALSSASAQRSVSARPSVVPDGLDMQIEGTDRFVAGRPLHFFLTAFEIRRGDEYRPAVGATVRVLSSYSPSEALVEQTTDAHGRATLSVTPPADMSEMFELVFVLRHRGLARHYNLSIHPAQVMVSLRTIQGSTLLALGSDLVTQGLGTAPDGTPAAGAEWILQTRHAGRVVHEQPIVTDAEGAFVGVYRPRREGTYTLVLIAEGQEEPLAELVLEVMASDPERARVFVNAPRYALQGETIPLEVMTFDEDRLPVQDAVVLGPVRPGQERTRVRTDVRGRATLPWHVDNARREIEVRAPGTPAMTVEVDSHVVSRLTVLSAWPEGGAFVVGAPSYVYIRAAAPDGQPLAQQRVEVASAAFEDQAVVTDDAGFARIETRIQARDLARPNSGCGGGSAIPVTLRTAGEQPITRCLAVDLDATLRLRVQRLAQLEVQVFRTPAVTGPVVVSVLSVQGERETPLRSSVLSGDTHRFALDPGTRVFEVRARSLVGPALHEVRGDMVRSRPALPATASDGSGSYGGQNADIRVAVDSRLGDRYARLQTRTALQDEAAQNRQWRIDHAAPAVLRDGEIIPVAAPETPVNHAIIRDAWRQRGRYRTGRLALIFRAVEEYLRDHGPARITRPVGQRLAFRRGALRAILAAATLGHEGRLDLGGRPIDFGDLEALDPTFGFDRVAARVSRTRLLEILIATRTLVHEHGLDVAVIRASPEDWWEPLRRTALETQDGWGRPFRFMPVRQAARYREVDPVRGYELVSAGPDGVYGNRDDIWDPTAAVLAPGSLYALAMDENRVTAELQGGAAGRGLVSEGQALLVARRPTPRTLGAVSTDHDPAQIRLLGPSSPADSPSLPGRRASLVTLQRRGGRWRIERTEAPTPQDSARLLTRFPSRIEAGETLRVPLVFLGGMGSPPTSVTVRVRAEGVAATLEASPSGALSESVPFETVLVLEANTAAEMHRGEVDIMLVHEGQVILEQQVALSVTAGDVGRSLTAGRQLAPGESWQVRFDAPAGAETRLVMSPTERPSQDPYLQTGLQRHPALWAWALALDGQELSAALIRRIMVEPTETPLETACALVALAATRDESSEVTPVAYEERQFDLREQLAMYVSRLVGDSSPVQSVSEAAAVLAALSSFPLSHQEPNEHSVWSWPMRDLRAYLRPAMGARHDAFVAAALLLVDQEDLTGMGAWIRASGFVGERPAATVMAYHLAHHLRTGETSRLSDAEVRRMALVEQTPVSLFWHLAAASRGTFGAERSVQSEHAVVEVNGGPAQTFDLRQQQETRIASQHSADRTAIRFTLSANRPVFARVEARFTRRERDRQEAPVSLALSGHAGTLADGGAFELIMTAQADTEGLTLALGLPSGIDPRPLIRALRDTTAVLAVGAVNASGQVRVRLMPMSEGETQRLPIALRWLASGTRRGISVGLWQTRTPWQISSLAPTELDVTP